MPADRYYLQDPSVISPIIRGRVATPSDTNDLPFVTREVFFPTGGTVRVTWLEDLDGTFTTHNVVAGDLRAWRIKRIWATGTTVASPEIFE